MLLSTFFSDIETIDKNEKLYLHKNFHLRAEALDFIEFHVIDRISFFIETPEDAGQLRDVKQYAEIVRRRLEGANNSLFHQLRSKIAGERLKGKSLMNLFETYFDGQLPAYDPQDAVGYDELDLFVNGILTYGNIPAETREREPEMIFYQKTPARIILEMINKADFKSTDVFFDLGSGLGQVVMLVHLLTGVQSKGVEFEPAFCDYARNIATELQLRNFEFINTDARQADYSSGTVFFLYSPFDGSLFREVLETLKAQSEKRMIKIFSYGPCTALVAQQLWLIKRSEIQYGPGAFGDFISI